MKLTMNNLAYLITRPCKLCYYAVVDHSCIQADAILSATMQLIVYICTNIFQSKETGL